MGTPQHRKARAPREYILGIYSGQEIYSGSLNGAAGPSDEPQRDDEAVPPLENMMCKLYMHLRIRSFEVSSSK